MRFVKLLFLALFSLGSLTGFAQTPADEPHKTVFCTETYRDGHWVLTDCQGSDVRAAGAPTELTVDSSDDGSSDSSNSASQGASSSELPTGSDAHPADGEASQSSADPSDIMDLELNN